WTEIITALLADIGFESFVESESGLLAYIPALVFNPEDIEKLDILKSTEFSVKYEINNIADKNWNAEWERNYNPVIIAEKCCVRAPFHNKDKKCTYDIIIEPKMSFGTAHHETTSLMLEQILALTIKNKSVLDMGCGTAVLAILAAKKGASSVIAIDNDEWAYNNSVENIKKNKTSCINVIMGDSNRISGTFDIILANINRNVLLNDIPKYVDHLDKSGILLLSGFYDSDVPAIKDKAQSLGLKFLDFSAKNKWTVLKFANNE
ncbi:MAG: 50S ribosomal protein L11 methyltransferase, partial [Bacteroidetes bacterium]|nr:50S ribosomal protein L11 methyltransferase [Bacteroidota bacterium]